MEDEFKLPIWVPRMFYRLVFISGVLFYFVWLIIFGVEHWNDIGVYSITIVLVGFGLVGAWVYDEVEKKELEEAENGNN